MAGKTSEQTAKERVRATALKHALSIEEKKRMPIRVADMIIKCFDLPGSDTTDPAHPSKADLSLFQEGLKLFQPSDLDDLVQERNIDGRCGYALCPQPHRVVPGGGEKVWNQKGGKDFKLLSKADIEKWCSKLCSDRTGFVRAQLSTEPSWLREMQNDVRLLDDVQSEEDLTVATKNLSLEPTNTSEIAEKLQELSLERGDPVSSVSPQQFSIFEKNDAGAQSIAPNQNESNGIEGYHPRKVRFA